MNCKNCVSVNQLQNGTLVCENPLSDEYLDIVDEGYHCKLHNVNSESCVCCGAIIPEGRQVCTDCEKRG